MESNIEIELDFTDVTMAETDGVFDDVKDKMESCFPYNKDWMIRTGLTISSDVGTGDMILNLYGNGAIYIVEYVPSIGEVFYNPDIQAFSEWAQENGWNIPQPKPDLAKLHKEFWKHFYDTLIIDSDYFDKVYGIRPSLQGDNND